LLKIAGEMVDITGCYEVGDVAMGIPFLEVTF